MIIASERAMLSVEIKQKPTSLLLAELTSELFSNCSEKEARYTSQFNVSVVEAKALRTLFEHESLTVNQLASELNLTSSRVTRICDNLVKKNLLIREIDDNDRRIFNLSLTEKGKKLTSDLIEGYRKIHEEILESIPEEYHQEMLHALELLNNAVIAWLEK